MSLNDLVTLRDLATINDLVTLIRRVILTKNCDRLVSLDENSVIVGVTVLLMVWSEITSGGMVGEKVSQKSLPCILGIFEPPPSYSVVNF
jgi:hypothetical protein